MDLADIRRTVIIAMFSDDTLMEQLVLKGGNALALVYGLGHRSSLDVDLSIDGDFLNMEETGTRIFTALGKHFAAAGWRRTRSGRWTSCTTRSSAGARSGC
jgi:predicted nucleotidyltransferase component of viral defense system